MATKSARPKPVEKSLSNGCVHHWTLTAPGGGIVGGACKHCGKKRTWDEKPKAIKKLEEYGR